MHKMHEIEWNNVGACRDLKIDLDFRGRPSFSLFTLMIISIISGGRGLKNDDNYHNFFIVQISWKCTKKRH